MRRLNPLTGTLYHRQTLLQGQTFRLLLSDLLLTPNIYIRLHVIGRNLAFAKIMDVLHSPHIIRSTMKYRIHRSSNQLSALLLLFFYNGLEVSIVLRKIGEHGDVEFKQQVCAFSVEHCKLSRRCENRPSHLLLRRKRAPVPIYSLAVPPSHFSASYCIGTYRQCWWSLDRREHLS